jgi:DNA-binding transcriptional ArsR family regulator
MLTGMNDVGAVLVALADPTRRDILDRVRERPRSVSEIASTITVTRSAVSQHLRVLQDAGLLSSRRRGRQNFYALDLRGLVTLRTYVEGFWTDVLGAFQAAAVAEAKARKVRN